MLSCLYSTRWMVIGRASRPAVGCSIVGVFPGVFPYSRHPRFRDFDPVVPVDVVSVEADLNRLDLGSASVPVWFPVNALDIVPTGAMTAEVWQRARRTSLSCSFILSCTGLPVSPMYTASHSPQGILYTTSSRLPGGTGFFCRRTRWLRRVVSDLKAVRMPCCSRQRRSVCETVPT